MSYCTVNEVSSLGTNSGKPYGDTSVPTATEVTVFADESYNEINGRLADIGFTVPIVEATSPISFSKVKEINKIGAAYRAEGVTYRRATRQEVTRYDQLKKDYEAKLQEIEDRPGILVDAVKTGGLVDPNNDPPYSRQGELAVDSELIEIEPIFKMKDEY